MIKKILAAIAAVAAFAALFFRGQSVKNKAEAGRQRERADAAEATGELRREVGERVSEIEQKHREEQINAKDRFDAGDRNHLDNNW